MTIIEDIMHIVVYVYQSDNINANRAHIHRYCTSCIPRNKKFFFSLDVTITYRTTIYLNGYKTENILVRSLRNISHSAKCGPGISKDIIFYVY